MAATAAARAAALTCSWKADVTWISRQFLPAFAPLQAMAKRPMILDMDDAVWLNTGGHRARDLARASDLVVCGNNFLAHQFSRWNTNVTVIPTAVNTSWYRPRRSPGKHAPPWSWDGPAPAAISLSCTPSSGHCCGYCSTAATPSCSSSPIGHRNSSASPIARRVRTLDAAHRASRLRPHVHRPDAPGRHRLVQRQVQLQNALLHGRGAAGGRHRCGNESRGAGPGRRGLERRLRAEWVDALTALLRMPTCAGVWAPPAALWSRSALACNGWRNNMRPSFSPWAENCRGVLVRQ